MQIYLYLFGIGIFSSIVWFLFHTIAINKKKKVFLPIKREEEINSVEPPKQMKKKKEIFYQLNTDAIRLNLYQKSSFNNYIIINIYRDIVVDNYWINEPFHSEFSNLLQFIGNNNLWIKDPKSREIIMNVRDDDDRINKQISINVLALTEVLHAVIKEIYLSLKDKNISKYTVQNNILSASIYVLSEAGDMSFICQILGVAYLDKTSLRYTLANKIYENLTAKSKIKIVENHFLNSIDFTKIYDEVIFNAKKYPYTFSKERPKKTEIRLLSHTPKKQLMSIYKF